MGSGYLDKRYKFDSIVIGFSGHKDTFIGIQKYTDEWYTVLLVPENSHQRYRYKVDQLDGLLDLLVKIFKRTKELNEVS